MGIQRLLCRLIEGVHRAGQERDQYDVPHLYHAEEREEAEQKYERRGYELGHEDEPALVQLVGKYASEKVERNRGRGVGQTDVS